ncbi:hypothetical protein [Bradyrhizobium sp. Bra64]|uniref:hypothetical protein n=1 Tax=Bradyrhizobium sp. Bra64 TaxID=2926009 RepID=UPI00211906CF|nr:hypothetical protein [Bradyrhizobium sp. Bra64]
MSARLAPRRIADPTFPRGRVEIRKDEALIAIAPTIEALVLISHALVVGEELRAHPNTMPHVKRWIIADARRRAGL